MSALPAVATRGRQFAIARMTRVDALGEVVVGQPVGIILADAEKIARSIDPRLMPTVVMVDKEAS